MKSLSLALIMVALLAGYGLLLQRAPSAASGDPSPSAEQLAVEMGLLQRYMDKLYWSAEAENTELTHYYLEKLQKRTQAIIAADYYEDGHSISRLAHGLLQPELEATQQSLANGNWTDFSKAYQTLLQRCNHCHQSTDHGYIRVISPLKPDVYSQSFQPK